MNIAKRDQRLLTQLIKFLFIGDDTLSQRLSWGVILVLLLVAGLFVFARPSATEAAVSVTGDVVTGAIPQPTATPQNENHCMMLTDGMCYIIFPDGCQVGEPVIFGSESAGVPVTCGTVKGSDGHYRRTN